MKGFEAWRRNVQNCRDVKNGEWRRVKYSEVMILGEKCVLALIYIYVTVCRYCAVRCLIIICFYLLFSNYWTFVF
jgi:hypothetical protein